MKLLKIVEGRLKRLLGLSICKYKWKKLNENNYTTPVKEFDINKVRVGKGSYGPLWVLSLENPNEHLEIGNYCSIAYGVKFILGGHHNMYTLSSYPFKVFLDEINHSDDEIMKGPITVKDDVWIGTDAIILSGVTIGQGAVIGAGSVVAKDVPPYAVYANNRIIKYRFEKDIVDKLIDFDYSKLEEKDIMDNLDTLYKKLDESFFESELYKKCLRSKV